MSVADPVLLRRDRRAVSARRRPPHSRLAFLSRLALVTLAAHGAGCSGGGGSGGSAALPAAPSGLGYPPAGQVVAGLPMTPLSPTLAAGSADQYQVSPALPAGISLDAMTGTIAGTPVAAVPLDTYTITASNAAGSAAFALDLEVIDPPLPVAEFSLAAATTAETAGTASAEVTLSSASATDVTLALLVTGTATAGSDFAALSPALVIPAGQVTASIDIALLDDPTDEPDETVVITLDAPAGALIGAISAHTSTIVDDDRPPQVRFADAALSLPETPGTTPIEVLLDRDSTAPIDVALAIGGTAQSGSDYILSPASLTVPPGSTSASFTLELLGDLVFEGDETILLELLPGAGASAGTPEVIAITVGEDDPPPLVELQGGGSAVEGGGPVALTVTLSDLSAADTLVSFLLGGSATAGADYLATPGPLSIPAGTLAATIVIDPLADAEVEGPETAEVTIVAATGAALGVALSATVTIDDAAVALPAVTLSGGGTVLEGQGSIQFVATLSAVSASSVIVPFALGGSATAGVDYPTPASPVAIPAGSLGTTITITPVDDGIGEGAEDVTVTLLPPNGATLGAPSSATVTIDESAPPPEVTIAAGGSVLETGSPLDLWVTLSTPATVAVEVTYLLGGSATVGLDFLASPSPVTIAAGETTAAIEIEPIPDGATEGTETIIVTIVQATGATLGAAIVATVSIDEAALPEVTLSGGGVSGLEGAGPIFLTASLSAPSLLSVQVNFAYSGSATPVVDYLAVPSPQTILPGTLSTSIAIDPYADGLVEPDETVIVTLTGASGATLGATIARTITIEDDTTATAPPSGLAYTEPAAVYTVGAAIAPNLATLASGSATTWSILPALPAGLELDPQTGAITGAPEEIQPAVPYLVVAGNSLGSVSVSITIEVRAAFAFAMSSPVVSYSPANGSASFSISLTVEEDLGSSPVAPHGIQSLRAGIGFDPQQIVVVSLAQGSALALVNGGLGPSFFWPFSTAGGITVAIVFSATPASGLLAPGPVEWGVLELETVPSWLTGDPDGEMIAVPWLSTLGNPPVPCELSYENFPPQVPLLLPGTITFQP